MKNIKIKKTENPAKSREPYRQFRAAVERIPPSPPHSSTPPSVFPRSTRPASQSAEPPAALVPAARSRHPQPQSCRSSLSFSSASEASSPRHLPSSPKVRAGSAHIDPLECDWCMVELLGSDFPLPAHVVLPEVISPIQGLGLFLIICFFSEICCSDQDFFF